MKVQELLANINNKEFDLERGLQVKKYLPIMDKKKFVMDVSAACTDDIDGFVTVDRFKMHIYFDMHILGAYTNLEIAKEFDEMVEQYDELCESGLLTKIIGLFKTDYDAMCVILEDDLKELVVQNSIDTRIVKIANKINSIIDVIGNKFNSFDLNTLFPEGADVNQLVEMMSMLK